MPSVPSKTTEDTRRGTSWKQILFFAGKAKSISLSRKYRSTTPAGDCFPGASSISSPYLDRQVLVHVVLERFPVFAFLGYFQIFAAGVLYHQIRLPMLTVVVPPLYVDVIRHPNDIFPVVQLGERLGNDPCEIIMLNLNMMSSRRKTPILKAFLFQQRREQTEESLAFVQLLGFFGRIAETRLSPSEGLPETPTAPDNGTRSDGNPQVTRPVLRSSPCLR